MTIKGKILYLGTDIEFSDKCRSFFVPKSAEISIEEKSFSKGLLVSSCTKTPLDIVMVDFSEAFTELSSLLEEIIFIKRFESFRSVLFISLFKDEEQKQEYNYLFTTGFQLSHIKGTETDTIFRDSFYIGFRRKIDFPVLALARNINKDLRVGICSTLSAMNNSEFILETDIGGSKSELNIGLPMFPDLKCESFKVKDYHPSAQVYPMTTGYTVAFPIPGAWEDDSDATIQPDTIDTWLDHNKEEFEIGQKTRVKILSSNISLAPDLFKKSGNSIIINFGCESENLEEEISSTLPSLIYLDLEDDVEGTINLSLLDIILSHKTQLSGHTPIIVLTNCPSSSPALQKAYNYSLIVATTGKLTTEMLLVLVNKFQKKQEDTIQSLPQYLKITSAKRQIDLYQTFIITSLTEHEITFLSDEELPLFTLLHFTLPLEFHATIVPANQVLKTKPNKFHYMAFIHGLTESELMILRQFVNQIIYEPLKEFSKESIKSAMTDISPKQIISSPIEPGDEDEDEIVVETKQVIVETKTKHKFPGKSKL